jgi:hypothetical protein
MVHTAKLVGRVLGRTLERKIEDVFVQDQFEFNGGKETGMQVRCCE